MSEPAPYDPPGPGCLRAPIEVNGDDSADDRDLVVVPGKFPKGLPPLGLQSISFMSLDPTSGLFTTVARSVQLAWVPQDLVGPAGSEVDTTLTRFFIFSPATTASFTIFFAKPWVVPLDTGQNKPMKIRVNIGGAGVLGATWQVTAQMVRVLDAEAAIAMKGGR